MRVAIAIMLLVNSLMAQGFGGKASTGGLGGFGGGVPLAIAYVGGTTTSGCVSGGQNGSGTCNPTYTPTMGNTILHFLRSNSALFSYAQDSNLDTLSQGQAAAFLTGYGIQSFTGLVPAAGLSYSVTGLSGSTNSLATVEYSGVMSVNLDPTLGTCSGSISGNRCTGTGTNVSVGVVLDDPNDVAVCSFSQKPTNGAGTFSGGTGNLRQTTTVPIEVVLDGTSANAGDTVTLSKTLSPSSAWIVACDELRTVPLVSPAYAIGQITPVGYGSLTGPSGCLTTSTQCTWAIKKTIAGSSYVIHQSIHSDFNDIQRTLTAVNVCSVLTAGICDGIHFVVDTPTLPGSSCQSYVQDTQPESNSNDNAYMIGGAGGGLFVTTTRSGPINPSGERQVLSLVEFVPLSGGAFSFDRCGTSTFPTPSNSFAGTPLTGLSGTNDAVVQGWTGGLYPQSTVAPYIPAAGQGESIPNHMAIWVAINQSPVGGALPAASITAAGLTNGGAGTAVALKYH